MSPRNVILDIEGRGVILDIETPDTLRQQLQPADVTQVAPVVQLEEPRKELAFEGISEEEAAFRRLPGRIQETLDISPRVGLAADVPILRDVDPTAGLLQINPADEPKGRVTNYERFLQNIGMAPRSDVQSLNPPNPLVRDKDYTPDVILYGPKAGIVVSTLKGVGLPVDPSQVRPESAKSAIGEAVGSFVGEVGGYTILARTLGLAGLSGFYKWAGTGAVKNATRGLAKGENIGDIVTSPSFYIEASLAGSPQIASKVSRPLAKKLSQFIRRPISEVPGKPFFREGQIVRRGEAAEGVLVDVAGREINPTDIFTPRSPAQKIYEWYQKSKPAIQDKTAQILQKHGDGASAFLSLLNKDTFQNVKEGAKTAKDHFIGATRFLWQAKNRGEEFEFKGLMDGIQTAIEREHIYAGMFLEDLRDAGILKWNGREVLPAGSPKTGETLAGLLEFERIESGSFRDILNKAFKFAQEKGVEVSGYRAGYFPRMLKTDVANELRRDAENILFGIKKELPIADLDYLIQPGERNAIAKIAQNYTTTNPKRKLSIALKTIIEDADNGIDNYGDALFHIRSQSFDDLFNPFGNLEKARKAILPNSFYERDARLVLPRYLRGLARRVATVETFGQQGEVASNLLKALNEKNPAEAKIAKQILDSWTGRINADPSKQLSTGVRNILKATTGFEVATKIGFGTATIPNITQQLISSVPIVGPYRAIRDGFKALQPAARSKMRRAGVVLDTAHDALVGFSEDEAWQKFNNTILNLSGFAPVNKANQYFSAAMGKGFIEDLYTMANRKVEGAVFTNEFPGPLLELSIPKIRDARTVWAQRKLGRYGYDWRNPLTPDDKARFMYQFSNDTQLQRNVLNEPLAANDPRFRWMFLFKRFGIKQAQLSKREVLQEAKYGNPAPLLRLAAGAQLGGEFVGWARNKLLGAVSGEPYYRESEVGTWERLAENVASVGAFGVVSDLTSTIGENLLFGWDSEELEAKDVRRVLSAFKFTTVPVQIQTMGDLYQWLLTDGAKVIADIDDPVTWREGMTELSKLFGSVARRVGNRLQTPGQKDSRFKSMRSRKIADMRDLGSIAISPDVSPEKRQSVDDEIIRIQDAWNQAYPEYWIYNRDISTKQIKAKEERAAEKKERRLFP